jgi:hypothetical protein
VVIAPRIPYLTHFSKEEHRGAIARVAREKSLQTETALAWPAVGNDPGISLLVVAEAVTAYLLQEIKALCTRIATTFPLSRQIHLGDQVRCHGSTPGIHSQGLMMATPVCSKCFAFLVATAKPRAAAEAAI